MVEIGGSSDSKINNPWFLSEGFDDDVVVSTRVRLARNLVNFSFPHCFKSNDAESVRALVFDAINQSSVSDKYSLFTVHGLEQIQQRLLIEMGHITSEVVAQPSTALALKNDGRVSCLVNSLDHVRISAYSPGLDAYTSYQLAQNLDWELQQKLQFAACKEFGYLTANLKDIGSGMKLSAIVHLRATTMLSNFERVLKDIMANGYVVSGVYGANKLNGFSLGSFYQVSTSNCLEGDEESQIEKFSKMLLSIIGYERTLRKELVERKPTFLAHTVNESYAIIKAGKFLTAGDSVEHLSNIKLGLDTKLLYGIDDNAIYSLLNMTQNAHLQDLLRSQDMQIEPDVKLEETKISRVRSKIVQSEISKVKIQQNK